MNRQQIERFFPNLSTSPYSITSPAEKGYNCIARQLGSGVWTSKLGNSEDIEHGKLEALEGQNYGIVAVVLKRQIHP